MRHHLLTLGLLLVLGSNLQVQAEDDYNPNLPAEPNQYYKLTLVANESNVAYLTGTGTYQEGAEVTVNTSARSTNYTFVCWQKDDEVISTNKSFQFTVTESTTLTAFYDFTPSVPADPTAIYERRIYLNCSPDNSCSFNRTSGGKVKEEQWVSLIAYPNQGFIFKGWYKGGELLSTNLSFSYLMGIDDVSLTALCEYAPMTPDDPTSAGGNIQVTKTGDMDCNGIVNVSDAIDLLSFYINGTTSDLDAGIADVDGNGKINVSDAIEIIDIYINNK